MQGKIVHLIGTMNRGGAERQLLHLAEQLQMRGWPQAIVAFSAHGAWRDRWAALRIPFYEVPRHRLKPWRLMQLSRIFGEERPAIVQSWSPHVAEYARWAWGARNALRVFGVRSDLTVDFRTGTPVRRIPHRGALLGADFVISNSRAALDGLRERGLLLPAAEVIKNIVAARGSARPDEYQPVHRIVAVGSLLPNKGHDCLLRAVAHLVGLGKACQVSIAGIGPELGRLMSLARDLNIEQCVHLVGATDNVPELLASAQMMVHPSKREGLSNAILEGMGEGLPVVSTWECASEIIENGRTGILVPAGGSTELAGAIGRLLDDGTLRGTLGAAALEYVRRHCNAQIVTDGYARVYHSLLGRCRGG